MRRQINPDLLVNTYKPKSKAKTKSENQINAQFKQLLQGYINLCGDRFDVGDLAKSCNVQKKTAQKWLYGYQASEGLLYPIAGCFAERMGVDQLVVYQSLLIVVGKYKR
jgi:hypothetical protein